MFNSNTEKYGSERVNIRNEGGGGGVGVKRVTSRKDHELGRQWAYNQEDTIRSLGLSLQTRTNSTYMAIYCKRPACNRYILAIGCLPLKQICDFDFRTL